MNRYWIWMVKKKQSSVKRYGSDISWHEVPISRTLPIEPCPTGPPAGIICLKMWARKTSMSFPSDKEGEQAVPSLSFRDSLSLSLCWQVKKLAQGSQMHVQLSKLHHFVMLPCCWAFYVVQADVPNSLWKTGTHDRNLKAFRSYGTCCWNYTHVKKLPTSGNIFLGGSNNMKKTASNVSNISSSQRIDRALAFR